LKCPVWRPIERQNTIYRTPKRTSFYTRPETKTASTLGDAL
jgi:hypothetical protein